MLSKEKKIAMIVLRISPLHNGHLEFIRNIFKTHDNCVFVIGSCYEFGKLKHCILPYYKEKFLRACLESENIDSSKYDIVNLQDYQTFEEWWSNILKLKEMYNVTSFVTGNKEDILCEIEAKDIGMELIDPELNSNFPYHATDIREAILKDDIVSLKKMVPYAVYLQILSSDILKGIYAADTSNAIYFNPGRQTVDMIVILIDDKTGVSYILLGKRNLKKKDFPGYFAIPGGGIDKFETALIASLRELFEETDIKLEITENSFEPAIVQDEFLKIHRVFFNGLYSSKEKAGASGGSSQCFCTIMRGDVNIYRNLLKSKDDLFDVDFYELESSLKKDFAFQQKDMIERAVLRYENGTLLSNQQFLVK